MISVALNWTFRLILGGALIVAGYFKLQDNSALFETVAYIYWLPNFFKSVIIDLLPWLEILLGFLLISKKLDNVALPFTAGIYLVFLLRSEERRVGKGVDCVGRRLTGKNVG